jgi:hypothetical protein
VPKNSSLNLGFGSQPLGALSLTFNLQRRSWHHPDRCSLASGLATIQSSKRLTGLSRSALKRMSSRRTPFTKTSSALMVLIGAQVMGWSFSRDAPERCEDVVDVAREREIIRAAAADADLPRALAPLLETKDVPAGWHGGRGRQTKEPAEGRLPSSRRAVT